MSFGEHHLHSFVGFVDVLLVLGEAIQNTIDIVSSVFLAVLESDSVRLSVVLDHLLVSAENFIVLLLLAKVYLLYIRESVRDMLWIVALFLGLLEVTLLHPFQGWRDVLLKLSESQLHLLVVGKRVFVIGVENGLDFGVHLQLFVQKFLSIRLRHIEVA